MRLQFLGANVVFAHEVVLYRAAELSEGHLFTSLVDGDLGDNVRYVVVAVSGGLSRCGCGCGFGCSGLSRCSGLSGCLGFLLVGEYLVTGSHYFKRLGRLGRGLAGCQCLRLAVEVGR